MLAPVAGSAGKLMIANMMSRMRLPDNSGEIMPHIRKANPVTVRVQPHLADDLLVEIPHLRAYARMMMTDVSAADKQVMETLDCVLSYGKEWRDRTHLRVRLFATLRALLERDESLRPLIARQEYAPITMSLNTAPESGSRRVQIPIGLGAALAVVRFDDRNAVILSMAAGFSDKETAEICGCATQIVRGRVQSGLARLSELMPDRAARV